VRPPAATTENVRPGPPPKRGTAPSPTRGDDDDGGDRHGERRFPKAVAYLLADELERGRVRQAPDGTWSRVVGAYPAETVEAARR
jgi:hypothetical protein